MGEKSTMFSWDFLPFEQLHQLLLQKCCRKEKLSASELILIAVLQGASSSSSSIKRIVED